MNTGIGSRAPSTDRVQRHPLPGLSGQPGVRGTMVNVSKAGEVYKCEICGNIVIVKEAGGGELVCCGEPMQLEGE